MQQAITGFHQDSEGHWVADLGCGHSQHVRHDPPWQVRGWVLEEATRREHLGTLLNCVRCDTEVAEDSAAYADARIRGLCHEGALEVARGIGPPRVGVAVIVRRDGRVLLGRRLSPSHGAGTWQFPGGHLEAFEDVETCAAREVAEETGLVITGMTRGPFTNDLFTAERRHYVTLYVIADAAQGEPVVREPEKCAEWRWFEWDALPAPLFLPIENLRSQGYRPPP
jgi:8-oxo-dGTP diphosphatase